MIIEDKCVYNNYIITAITLLLISILINLKNINIFNNIIFKILYLILIYLIINKYSSIGFFLAIIYIILDQKTTYYKLNNDLKQLEYSKQLEHYTQDYIIENNINKFN